jgi:hypothetical protein
MSCLDNPGRLVSCRTIYDQLLAGEVGLIKSLVKVEVQMDRDGVSWPLDCVIGGPCIHRMHSVVCDIISQRRPLTFLNCSKYFHSY